MFGEGETPHASGTDQGTGFLAVALEMSANAPDPLVMAEPGFRVTALVGSGGDCAALEPQQSIDIRMIQAERT